MDMPSSRHLNRLLVWTLIAGPALHTPGRAEEAPAPQRPKYNPVFRDREDWSKFTPRAEGGDLFDPLKHISLTDDDWLWVSFGGQVRLRFELWENFATSEARTADEELFLTRVRAHMDVHAGEHLRFFFEGLSANANERNFRADGLLDVNTAQLQQAFADVRLPLAEDAAVTLRGGRQELAFGKQRLVSPLDWSNTRRTWEGVKATVDVADWSAAGFWTQFVPVQKYEFDTPDAQHEFYGVYATGLLPLIDGANLDLYYLGRDRKDALTGMGDQRNTFGGRLFGKIGDTGLDYDVEGAYQNGRAPGRDVDAFFVAAEAGYTFADCPWKPRLFAGIDYATGDSDPADDTLENFDQLFPLGHAYFGYIDLIGRPNMLAWNAGFSFTPLDKLTVLVQGHIFWLAEDTAPLFNAGGGPITGRADTRDVGGEIDLLLKYQHDAHTQILIGYSHFFAGDFFDLPGRGQDIDFFYLSWEYTF
jgi:hypothetical protein